MPSPEQIEYAGVLLRKAEDDLAAVTALVDRSEIADDIVGVADRIADPEAAPPRELADAAWLTAWATEFRYADPPPPALHPKSALAAAEVAVAWARSVRDDFAGS